jgi:hypothetical protein
MAGRSGIVTNGVISRNSNAFVEIANPGSKAGEKGGRPRMYELRLF